MASYGPAVHAAGGEWPPSHLDHRVLVCAGRDRTGRLFLPHSRRSLHPALVRLAAAAYADLAPGGMGYRLPTGLP